MCAPIKPPTDEEIAQLRRVEILVALVVVTFLILLALLLHSCST